jgi:hypothetical protein
LLLRSGWFGRGGIDENNLYRYVNNSPISNQDPYGLNLWRKIWDVCFDTGKDKAKEKAKEWVRKHIPINNAEKDMKNDCDFMEQHPTGQSSDTQWYSKCFGCANYSCAYETDATSIEACVYANLEKCRAGQAP